MSDDIRDEEFGEMHDVEVIDDGDELVDDDG